MTWGLQELQVVWWTDQTLKLESVNDLHHAFVGAAAISTQSSPASGSAMAVGQDEKVVYRTQVQSIQNRVDFFINPVPGGETFPSLGKIAVVLQNLEARIDGVVRRMANVNRLALVLNVFEVQQSIQAANLLVARQAGVNVPFEDVVDFVYQLNRIKPLAKFPTVELNRILKWAAQNVQIMELGSGAPNLRQFPLSTVSVDVNVVPLQNRRFDASEQISILREIIHEAGRLSEERTVSCLGG